MPPAIVLRRLELDGRQIGPEAGEALRAFPLEDDAGEKVPAERERVEEILAKRGEFSVVAVSVELLEQEEIDKINADSPLEGSAEAE